MTFMLIYKYQILTHIFIYLAAFSLSLPLSSTLNPPVTTALVVDISPPVSTVTRPVATSPVTAPLMVTNLAVNGQVPFAKPNGVVIPVNNGVSQSI